MLTPYLPEPFPQRQHPLFVVIFTTSSSYLVMHQIEKISTRNLYIPGGRLFTFARAWAIIYTFYGIFYYPQHFPRITSIRLLSVAIIQRRFMYPIVKQIDNDRIDVGATTPVR